MNKFIISASLLSVIFLSGCAVQHDSTKLNGMGLTYQSNVSKLSDGNYFTEVEAAPAAGRIPGAVAQATKNAANYCKQQNQGMKEIKTETDSHALINGVAKVTFQCV